jgi:hypothetical protein
MAQQGRDELLVQYRPVTRTVRTAAPASTPVMLKKKSFHSLYFDKDCRTLATSKAKILQCTIAFLRNNPSVFTLLLMNSSGSMSTYCSQ